MKESIYTIPIQEAFAAPDGCPVCALRAKLERETLEYVMGAAMMEPDVRIETNKRGFCAAHLEKLLGMKNRLSLALMLESLFGELSKAPCDALPTLAGDCYVCRRTEDFHRHFLENILALWKDQPEFRDTFRGRRDLCFPHAAALVKTGQAQLSRKLSAQFSDDVWGMISPKIKEIQTNLSVFCKSFDYRFAGQDLGQAKTAVEDAAGLLMGRDRA